MLRSLVPFALAFALAACSQSQGHQVVAPSDTAAGYPARLAIAGAPQQPDIAPMQPEGAVWQALPDRIAFGVPGQRPLLSLACEHDSAGAASLRIMRATRAEAGAKALFAVIGNGRIARLPIDAVQPGEAGRWEAAIPATDLRLDVFRGAREIEATLPGGGTLKLSASSEPGRLLAACRASDTAPQPSQPA